MSRIANWTGNFDRGRRNTDPWRTRLPLPRYLRNSPLRILRERLWFVSRLQPKVALTVNTVTNRMTRIDAAPSLSVFLNRWLTVRTAAPAPRAEAPAVIRPATQVTTLPSHPPALAARPAKSAYVIFAVEPARAVPPQTIAARPLSPEPFASRFRARRMEELTPEAPARVVMSRPAVISEASESARDPFQRPWRTRPFEPSSPQHPGAPAAAPPAIDTEQLADQVLRQIDRRLIASRERMGRI